LQFDDKENCTETTQWQRPSFAALHHGAEELSGVGGEERGNRPFSLHSHHWGHSPMPAHTYFFELRFAIPDKCSVTLH
jgi:hypothetical protein